jgi:hypothetical protein
MYGSTQVDSCLPDVALLPVYMAGKPHPVHAGMPTVVATSLAPWHRSRLAINEPYDTVSSRQAADIDVLEDNDRCPLKQHILRTAGGE